MKKIILIIFFFLNGISFSQANNKEIKSFYKIAMTNHIKKIKEDIKNKISTLNLNEIYFISDLPIDYLPMKSDKYEFKYLDIYNKRNKKLIKKGIIALSIQNININKNKISISIIEFNVHLKKKKYCFSNGGSSKTTFLYSCSQSKWIFNKTTFYGI